jgi:erythromycin esterase-like protein
VRRADELVRAAVPIELDGEHGSLEPFSVLDPVVERCRVAYLVEMDHFVHEKYDFRLLVLRYLASRGWRWFGEELGWTDGVRIDRYLTTADERHLDSVATYGYRGGERGDRDDRATGILAESMDRYPTAAFRHEQRAFARAVRRVLPDARWFGFDVDYAPGIGYEEIDLLLTRRSEAGTSRLRAAIARRPGESLAAESRRLRAAWGELSSRGEDRGALAHALRTMVSSLDYVALAHPALSYEALRPAMALRERVMHANVRYVLLEAAPAERVALMAGSLHLMKDDALVVAPGVGAGPGGGTEHSIGHVVCQELSDGAVASFWMLHGRGRSAGPYLPDQQELAAAKGTVDATLAAALPAPSLVPVAPTMTGKTGVTQMHNLVMTVNLAAQVDALVFVPEVRPLSAGS